MRIGLISEKTGVSRDTIRLYEKMGLLTGITRPYEYNNYKEYSEDNIKRVNFILLLKKLGLSLKECKEVIDTISENRYNKDFQNEFLIRKIETIDKQINELIDLRNTLKNYLDEGCSNENVISSIKSE